MACKVIVGDQEYSFEDFRKHLKTDGIDDFIKNNKQHFYAKALRGNQEEHAQEGAIAQGSENVSQQNIQRDQEEGGGAGNGPLGGGLQNIDQQEQEISQKKLTSESQPRTEEELQAMEPDLKVGNYVKKEGNWYLVNKEGAHEKVLDLNKPVSESAGHENAEIKELTVIKDQLEKERGKKHAIDQDERNRIKNLPRNDIRSRVRGFFFDGGKIKWKSSKKGERTIAGAAAETGGKEGERRSLMGIQDEKNGKTVQEIAHKLWEEQPEGDNFTDADYRDAIIDLLSSSDRGQWYADQRNQEDETFDFDRRSVVHELGQIDERISELEDQEKGIEHQTKQQYEQERTVYGGEEGGVGGVPAETTGETAQSEPAALIRENGNEDKSQQALIDLGELNLTHVSGLGMGQNQAKGTYVSTEKAGNRYATEEKKPVNVKVNISNPFVADGDVFAGIQRSAIQQRFGKNSIDDLTDAEVDLLAEMMSDYFVKEGYDSIYFPETETQEGELIVFDKTNVEFENEPSQKSDVEQGSKSSEPPHKIPGPGTTMDAGENEQPSGIKKALVPEEKVATIPVDKRTDKEVLAQGKEDVDSGKVNPQAIIDGVKNETRALQPNEVAALVYYKAQLDNQLRAATDKLSKATDSSDYVAQNEAKAELESLEKQLDDYYEMSVKTANQQSMAFRLRKMLLDSEYNLQSQVAKYKAKNKGEIEPEVLEKFKQLEKDLKEANARIDKLVAQQEEKQSASYLDKIKEMERTARRKAITADRKKKITNAFDSLKVDTSNKGMMSASVLPGITLLPHVWNGSVEVVKQAVLAGADVTEAIQAGIDYIKKNAKTPFNEKKYIEGMTPLVQKIVPKVKTEESLPYMKDDRLVIPKQLVKELVASGVTDVNDLVEQIHSLLKDTLPDVTIREVRDAFTRYGKVSTMSQDEIDVEIRKMKRAGKLISGLEDVKNKIRPLRSGLQRDKLTDEERKMQRELRELMKDLPEQPEDEARTWKTALDKVKSRLTNQISDLEEQIKKGEKTPKKKGIEYDQEALELQAKRDELKAILQQIEGEQGISDEQRIRMAEKSAEKALAEYERRIKEGDFSKKERKAPADSETLTELRAKKDVAKEQLDKIKHELGLADKERLERKKKSVQRSIEEYERRIKEGDFGRKKTAPVAADAELTKAQGERERIKHEYDVAQEKNRLANRTNAEKVADIGLDVANLPKTLLSSSDFSAALRQGVYLLPRYPVKWAKAFVEMFRQAASQKRYDEFLFNLKGSDMWPLIQQSKLFIADSNAKISAREEQFMSQLAKKIPIIGQSIKIGKNITVPGLDLIGKSNRAYAGFLNKLRLDVFSAGADQLQQDGKTFESHPEEFKALADWINNATGRGKLLKVGSLDIEKAAPVLNTIFFSPRFLASRLNLMNPVYYAKMPKAVRQEALKTSMSFVVFGMAILAMSAGAGADVELDPRSPDFGKIKIGNTRYDIWGGFQSVARFLAQMMTGQRKNAAGEIIELDGKKFGSDDRLDVAGKFLRGKLAPTPGTLVNFLKGKNIIGEEVTVKGELIKNTVPLYLQDMKDIFEKEGAAGVLETGLPAMFGVGVQNYEPKKKKEKSLFPELDVDKMMKKIDKDAEKMVTPY